MATWHFHCRRQVCFLALPPEAMLGGHTLHLVALGCGGWRRYLVMRRLSQVADPETSEK